MTIQHSPTGTSVPVAEPTPTRPIQLSIALVTRNRPASLTRCLDSWRSQVPQPFEILVSDDSDAAIRPEIESICKEFRVVYLQGPRRGQYSNRNHAMRGCSGSHVMTADDDHTHPPDFVKTVLGLIESDPRRVWVFSERIPARPDAALICPAELAGNGVFTTPPDMTNCAAFAEGSTIFPSSAVAEGARFDESYRFGPIYYLFGHSLRRLGYRISFSDSTYVWHHVETSLERSNLVGQVEALLYVQWIYATGIQPGPGPLARAVWLTVRALTIGLPVLYGDVLSPAITAVRMSPLRLGGLLRKLMSTKCPSLFANRT